MECSGHSTTSSDPGDAGLFHYLDGEVTAEQAADLLGRGVTVAEVVLATRDRFGRLPDPTGPFVEGELRRALSMLGLGPRAPACPET